MARSFQTDEGATQRLKSLSSSPEIVQQARERLSMHEHIRIHSKAISMEFREGVLAVTGTLPSFYLKQVLQTILRDLPGVTRIDNRVEVNVAKAHGAAPHGDQHFSKSRNSDNERQH